MRNPPELSPLFIIVVGLILGVECGAIVGLATNSGDQQFAGLTMFVAVVFGAISGLILGTSLALLSLLGSFLGRGESIRRDGAAKQGRKFTSQSMTSTALQLIGLLAVIIIVLWLIKAN